MPNTITAVSQISLLRGDHPVRLEQGARGVQKYDNWLDAKRSGRVLCSTGHPSRLKPYSPQGEILSNHFLNGVDLLLGKNRSHHPPNGSLPSFLYIGIEL